MTNIKNIDIFDKKILDLLLLQSNASLQVISKKINRSKSFCGYILKNLQDKKIIERIYPIIDITKLGVYALDLYIKTNMNEEIEKKFISNIANSESVYYIERLIGNYSIKISIFSESINNSVETIKNYFKNYEDYIEDISFNIVNLMIKTQNSLFQTFKSNKYFEFFKESEKLVLTKKEIVLLRNINDNLRSSILELSFKTKFSREFIAKTIDKFEKRKIIVGYSADIDIEKLGYISKLFLIKLKFINKIKFAELIKNLISISNIQTITTYFPEDYLSLEIIFKNENELRNLQIKLLNEYKKYISEIKILDYYDEPKYSYMTDFLRTLPN